MGRPWPAHPASAGAAASVAGREDQLLDLGLVEELAALDHPQAGSVEDVDDAIVNDLGQLGGQWRRCRSDP